ncbi:UDP-N-acetylmuramoyl-L-alanyl-D-glutamate--2,6-diaminopimelate ligase [Porphyromonas gingivicanis]|uniref:UDP-N-acetylmuramoyl-L-alanyl-D-glutamate--2, 6-diaminopimelate ligase n=1 Tax=Porphyromonas gingivicanis TaxID=266762 RepID=UPI000B2AC2B7|nr:UDP-N-acetylmuramoyl-L-alanyl-D-glutamate--2,6-diaminopimelate ligase [Porphyromonas gingivicanis]
MNDKSYPCTSPRSITLKEIIKSLQPWFVSCKPQEVPELAFSNIASDSRKVVAGGIFVAISGVAVEGWSFISQVVEGGVRLIVGEPTLTQEEQTLFTTHDVVYIQVSSSPEALAALVALYWDYPSEKMQLIGVTGTNGKTTTATLLYRLFSQLGYQTGLIGTVENRIGKEVIPATHTTPDPISLGALLHQMYISGCSYVFMEVSSHAVVQRRIGSLFFRGGIFTNLTRDHLDYHGTMLEYIRAKKGFFDSLSTEAFALINADDKNGATMIQNCRAQVYTYSLNRAADFSIKVVERDLNGTALLLDNKEVWSRLVGNFNAYNMGVVYAATRLLLPNLPIEELLTALSNLQAAEGRFEVVYSGTCTAIVDYAHTPDALIKVLETIRPLLSEGARLITVVGAGGNRDKGKRPIMAQEAFRRSDLLLLTSDNPRNEEPEQIIQDMLEGLTPQEQLQTLINKDRKEAIRTACRLAQKGDVILVAGKGHETYQEIAGVRHHFDDREELRTALSLLNNPS